MTGMVTIAAMRCVRAAGYAVHLCVMTGMAARMRCVLTRAMAVMVLMMPGVRALETGRERIVQIMRAASMIVMRESGAVMVVRVTLGVFFSRQAGHVESAEIINDFKVCKRVVDCAVKLFGRR